MSKIALVVEFIVKPGRRAEFVKHISEHARGTRADEAGCVQFDVLVPREVQYDVTERKPDENRVLLYEVYRDEAAFNEHLKNPRLAKTREGYQDMIESRRITRSDVQ